MFVNNASATSTDLTNQFTSYLAPNETILWTGQPQSGLRWLFSPLDIFFIPFSLFWGGFSIFWEYTAMGGTGFSVFALFGLPFVLIGQYLIWGRFVHKYLRRRATYYALTDQRALVLSSLGGMNLKAYLLNKIVALQLQGSTVLFDLNEPAAVTRGKQNDIAGDMQPGFYALVDVADVYRRLQERIMPPRYNSD